VAATTIETLNLKDLDQAALTAWSEALGDPEWLRARRLAALAALDKLERPTVREEAWRFTDPKRAGLDRQPIIRAGGQDGGGQAGVFAGGAAAAGHADSQLEPGGLVTVVDGAATGADLAAAWC
jgi:hypothetical protein